MIDASPELSILFKDLFSPSTNQWLDLFNNKKVRRHMPLASDFVDTEWVENWIRLKIESSENCPFKVQSVWINENFAGWAAIQKDDIDYEMAIVLNPTYWGVGINVFQRLIKDFQESKIKENLYVYLPISRNIKNIAKKFKVIDEGIIEIDGIQFTKLRLNVGGEGFT